MVSSACDTHTGHQACSLALSPPPLTRRYSEEDAGDGGGAGEPWTATTAVFLSDASRANLNRGMLRAVQGRCELPSGQWLRALNKAATKPWSKVYLRMAKQISTNGMERREEMSELQKRQSVEARHHLPKSTRILRALLAKMTLSCHHKVHKILALKTNLTKVMFKLILPQENKSETHQAGTKKESRERKSEGAFVKTSTKQPPRNAGPESDGSSCERRHENTTKEKMKATIRNKSTFRYRENRGQNLKT